jgi:hypothetical protein
VLQDTMLAAHVSAYTSSQVSLSIARALCDATHDTTPSPLESAVGGGVYASERQSESESKTDDDDDELKIMVDELSRITPTPTHTHTNTQDTSPVSVRAVSRASGVPFTVSLSLAERKAVTPVPAMDVERTPPTPHYYPTTHTHTHHQQQEERDEDGFSSYSPRVLEVAAATHTHTHMPPHYTRDTDAAYAREKAIGDKRTTAFLTKLYAIEEEEDRLSTHVFLLTMQQHTLESRAVGLLGDLHVRRAEWQRMRAYAHARARARIDF